MTGVVNVLLSCNQTVISSPPYVPPPPEEGDPEPTNNNFPVGVSPSALYGQKGGSGTIQTSQPAIATTYGGVGPYTYLWEFWSGDTEAFVNNPNSSTTKFSYTAVGTGIVINAKWRCKVTDSTGGIAYSPIVNIELENYDTGGDRV